MTSVLRELPLSYIDCTRRTLRPRHATPALARVFRPAQLLAQYGDRLICVRYRGELLVAERDWQPPPPRFAHDQIVGLRVAFADVAVRDRVKQAGGTWNPERGSGSCATIAWLSWV